MRNSFNIQKTYEQIIAKLQQGKSVSHRFSADDVAAITLGWEQALKNHHLHDKVASKAEQLDKIKMILCLLDHTHQHNDRWGELIRETLNIFIKNIDHLETREIIVLVLGTSHRHVIGDAQRKGNRVDFKFLQALESLLSSNDPNIVEWTLRTIECLGGQSIFFKKKILQLHFGLFSRFQKKWKDCRALVEYLDQQWGQRQI